MSSTSTNSTAPPPQPPPIFRGRSSGDHHDSVPDKAIGALLSILFFFMFIMIMRYLIGTSVGNATNNRSFHRASNNEDDENESIDKKRERVRKYVNIYYWSELAPALSQHVQSLREADYDPEEGKSNKEDPLGSVRSVEQCTNLPPDGDEEGNCNADDDDTSVAGSTLTTSTCSYLDHECCSICLCAFHPDDIVCQSRRKQCLHVFHLSCMSQWLTKHDECPMCRERYLPHKGDKRSGGGARAAGERTIEPVRGASRQESSQDVPTDVDSGETTEANTLDDDRRLVGSLRPLDEGIVSTETAGQRQSEMSEENV